MTFLLLAASGMTNTLTVPRAASNQRVIGRLRIHLDSRKVFVGGEPVELTGREYELLLALSAEPTRVFTRHELLRDVWGYPHPAAIRTRTIDSHVLRLRHKLGRDYVRTIWGVGFRLTDPT